MSTHQVQTTSEDPFRLKTILVVEDDEAIGEMIVEALKLGSRYHALLARTGTQALDMLNGFKPSLFLLDYALPDINGIELYDQFHDSTGGENIPTIMMSANLPSQEARERNITCISKPFKLRELLQTIEALLT